MPAPSTDSLAREIGLPGEEFWQGMGVLDADDYETRIAFPDRAEEVRVASRLLILTSQRLIVLYPEPGKMMALPYEQVTSVSLEEWQRPWSPREAVIALEFRFARGERAGLMGGCRWGTRRSAAKQFVRKFSELLAAFRAQREEA